MSQSNQNPDLEDSINVTEAHGRVVREAAACARENRVVDTGVAPVSLWAFVLCGVVLLIAGSILGTGGRLFAYNSVFREGYVRTPAPGVDEVGAVTREALAAYSARGGRIYSAKCTGCHGPDGRGSGASFPSLAGSSWVTGETERLAMIILNGLDGPVSDGKTYGAMPPQGIGMTPEDLAGVMTFVRNSFGNETGDVVSVEMARNAIEVSAARPNVGRAVNAAELAAAHEKALSGTPIEPNTMVDPISLAPVEAPAP
jgi:mono/diheme cytochrome c family protein